MRRWPDAWKWRSAALAAGALLRVAFVERHPDFTGDALVYGDLAKNMLQLHRYALTVNHLAPSLIRLPGYPSFLAVIFGVFGMEHYGAALWVQVVVDLVSCLLLGLLAERVWGHRVGLAAIWLAALCPFTANYTAMALTETWSLFCVVLAFFALERWISERSMKWAVLAGAALAGAVLLRPEQGLLSAAVVPAMLWAGWKQTGSVVRGARGAVVAAVIVVVPLMMWGARNWRVFHLVQPLAPESAMDPGEPVPSGFQRWFSTWGVDFKSTYDVYWTYDGAPLAMKDLPPRAFDSAAQEEETERLYGDYNAVGLASDAFDVRFAKLAAERRRVHPVRSFVWMPLAREADMWLRPRTELMDLPMDWWNVRAHAGASFFEMGYAGLDVAYLVLAVVGLARWRKMGTLGWSMVGFVGMRCALLLTLNNSEPRYTLECFPVVILLGALGICGGGAAQGLKVHS